jgi:hypothetical protein
MFAQPTAINTHGPGLTRRVQLVQPAETAYPSGAPEFTPVFSGICVNQYLVLYVCFVDRCLSFCPFPFGHCVVCSLNY